MAGRQAVAARWLEFLLSMALILVTNRKKETHFDYNAEVTITTCNINMSDYSCGAIKLNMAKMGG